MVAHETVPQVSCFHQISIIRSFYGLSPHPSSDPVQLLYLVCPATELGYRKSCRPFPSSQEAQSQLDRHGLKDEVRSN